MRSLSQTRRCTFYLGSDKSSVTSDGTGKVEKRITPSAAGGAVVLGTADTPYQDEQLQISIGELDPIDSLSGQAARLNNLGYFAGTPATADDAQFESAGRRISVRSIRVARRWHSRSTDSG